MNQFTTEKRKWKEITSRISNDSTPIIEKDSLQRHIVSLPQSTFMTTKLLPDLNSGTKQKVRLVEVILDS